MKFSALAVAALLPCLAASLGDLEKAKSFGNPSAPVRIDVFSDFQCPACKVFHETLLPVLIRDYVGQGKVYIVSREFPLNMHPYSREAAGYAVAATQVGKYQQVADTLFHSQSVWGTNGKVWDTVASVLNPTEQKKVQSLAKDPSVLAQIQQDVDYGNSLKINQTPTIYISKGQKRYPYAGPDLGNYPFLRALIDDLITR
ncbi:MAG TPA: thioredoxin domain-containing protein [Bryobacteraceae bacterium]|nr:thioredoxin domain-containing protein [Bryobacteraceae bacterium]